MGFKLVCNDCRVSFSIGNDNQVEYSKKCRNCGENAHLVHHKFKPPKKSDKKSWEIVEFLISHGFDFSSAYVPLTDCQGQYLGNLRVDYPKTMEEAKEFVKMISPNKLKI